MSASPLVRNGDSALSEKTNPGLTEEEYQCFCEKLESLSGIRLGEGKLYLVNSRLSRLMNRFACASVSDLVKKFDANPRGDLVTAIIDAMTTNETKWFRDGYPFDALSKIILPEWVQQGKSQAEIYSAACSFGQEAYSISMVCEEFSRKPLKGSAPKVRIVGSDISSETIDRAARGIYENTELARGLTPVQAGAHFDDLGDGTLRVAEPIRRRVRFVRRNLFDSMLAVGRFDVIFCRNVLIYFGSERKHQVLSNILSVLNTNGYLIVGGSESLGEVADQFEMITVPGGVIYRYTK